MARRAPDPVLQQVEHFGEPTISVNDAFRPVSRYFDRITRPEQLIGTLQQVAPPTALYEAPANPFVASFIGENNAIAGEVAELGNGRCRVKTADGVSGAWVARSSSWRSSPAS